MIDDVNVEEQQKVSVDTPILWNVKIFNDDFTPFDFVISVLVEIFKKTETEAENLAGFVHTNNEAIVGIYTKDIAFTKCNKAKMIAIEHGHPLQLTAIPSS